MRQVHVGMILVLMILLCAGLFSQAQQTVATNTNVAVPPLVNFSGVLTDVNGKPLTDVVGVTFLLYEDSQGGAPLWMETQNVQPDKTGHYTVMLGSTSSQGLPADIFVAGEAHWLGVQVQGQDEQPRVLLVSAPYALKAGDAETIGGLPPSAFVLAAPPNGMAATANGTNSASSLSASPATSSDVTTAGGTVGAVPLWDAATDITSSAITQTGSGTTVKIGINNTTPATTLDVKGSATLRGATSILGSLALPATGLATATGGKNSQPLGFTASAFNGSTTAAANQVFQWQAEPAGNDTSTPSGTLNLLFGEGTAKPSETGLHISSKGLINFATGQTFPGTGDGTITGVTTATGSGLSGGGTSGTLNLSLTNACAANQVLQWNGTAWACTTLGGGGSITGVTAGTDLTGGGTSGNVTLNLNTAATDARYAQLGANNLFTGNLSTSGSVTAQVGNFDGTSSTPLLNIVQTGTGDGGVITASTGYAGLLVTGKTIGISATASCSGCNGAGVQGYSNGGTGVSGQDSASTGSTIGVLGTSASSGGTGVYGSSLGTGVYGQSNALGSGVGVGGLSTGGMGVYGSDGATTGTAYGVYGSSLSTSGNGVAGTSPNTGVYGISTGTPGYGVYGYSPGGSYGTVGVSGYPQTSVPYGFGVAGWAYGAGGMGVYGSGTVGVEGWGGTGSGVYGFTNGLPSQTGKTFGFYGGVWGDTGANWGDNYNGSQPTDCAMSPPPVPCAAGLTATADNANAADIANNTSQWYTMYTVNFGGGGTGTAAPVLLTSGGTADSGKCSIDTNGDVGCTGRVGAYAPVDGGARRVSLYAMQSAENWFEDAGSGQLTNGSARIALDPTFAQTVNTGLDYHIFLTPNGDCKGLYVSQKTATSFEVHELGGGSSSIAFDYRIMAKRSGYENVRLADVTEKYRRMQVQERAAGSRNEQQALSAHLPKPSEPLYVSPPMIAPPAPPAPPKLPTPPKPTVTSTRQVARAPK